ncbi:MAG: C4-type zinc ribbon domain-containing protein [Verrucomicrobiae bacterium]|nr:C4-type zinc ribbon domain-containing protein [Verrucomicrobiae bacterium]MDW8342857.1 C4-type zinc ribbon domain-containing protein [Verrucomicrobiae bacterium]
MPTMLPILEQLLVLQDRDQRVSRIKAELARIPHELAAIEAAVKAESAKLEQLKQQAIELEKNRKKLELDAESKRSQVAKYRAQSSAIKSNVEYQALLREIAQAEEEIRRIEDEELVLMEQAEQLQPQVRAAQQALAEAQNKASNDRAAVQRRADVLEAELVKLQTERADLARQIEPDVLSRYERLLKSKRDAVVVPIRNGNCGGCHLHVPPQVCLTARSGTELVSCDYCGRILYWPAD